MSSPEVALIVSTYERPQHLARCLLSIANQMCDPQQLEVVVTDDGSTDETLEVVRQFAEMVEFRVQFTTHEHDQFRLARCRNEGVCASSAPYLIFLDGDLVVPADFVEQHLAHRRSGVTVVGESCWLDEETTGTIDAAAIQSHDMRSWCSPAEAKRLRWKSIRGVIYGMLRLNGRPRLKGGNVALWREDYERINGYDEEFVGWGEEDTDLRRRLQRSGVRFRSSIHWARTYHLWHSRHSTAKTENEPTHNMQLLASEDRPARCLKGLGESESFEIIGWGAGHETRREFGMNDLHVFETDDWPHQALRFHAADACEATPASEVRQRFDRVVCLNLRERTDRWSQFCRRIEQAAWPFKEPERFFAVDGRVCTPPDWMRNSYAECEGAWGCYQSYVRILEQALLDDVDSLLVLEDDAVFVPGFSEKVAEFLSQVPRDWDHLFFGGEHKQEPTRIGPDLYRCHRVHRTHAHALGRKFIRETYDYLISYPTTNHYVRRGLFGFQDRLRRILRRPKPLFSTSDMERSAHVDHHFGFMHLTGRYNVYAPATWLVGQSAGTSSILEEDVPEKFWSWEDSPLRLAAA